MTSSMHLRIRLLEPSIGVVTGSSRLLIHGKGFRPTPHSLVVRFKVLLPEAVESSLPPATAVTSRVDIPGKFLLESQMECVLPSFQDDVNKFISHLTKPPATSATVLCSPQLLHVQAHCTVAVLGAHLVGRLEHGFRTSSAAFCVHEHAAMRGLPSRFLHVFFCKFEHPQGQENESIFYEKTTSGANFLLLPGANSGAGTLRRENPVPDHSASSSTQFPTSVPFALFLL